MRPGNTNIIPLAALLAAALAAGCASNATYTTADRMDNGLVIVLPGIEGESGLNRDIRRGLDGAGLQRAIPIRSWGSPVPVVGMLAKQMDFVGNRLTGAAIAREIVAYQDQYPGRPVHIVGHSGGGGIAVFVAEAMPEGRQLDGLVLLSASISSSHDMTRALAHCKSGIVNFYSGHDALLSVGTTVVGNVCGTHGPGAGLIGFDGPSDKASDEKKALYTKLFQIRLRPDMLNGRGASHVASTEQDFVFYHVAPWVYSSLWPAAEAQAYLAD